MRAKKRVVTDANHGHWVLEVVPKKVIHTTVEQQPSVSRSRLRNARLCKLLSRKPLPIVVDKSRAGHLLDGSRPARVVAGVSRGHRGVGCGLKLEVEYLANSSRLQKKKKKTRVMPGGDWNARNGGQNKIRSYLTETSADIEEIRR